MIRFNQYLIYTSLVLATLLVSRVNAGPPPPSVNQCKSKWVLTATQAMDFGGFAIEPGSDTIKMDNAAALTTTTGLASLSSSIPVTTFVANVDNSKSPICASYGFTLSWNTLPAPLAGPGTAIPLANVRVSIPAPYNLTNVTLPQTIAPNPGNTIPFNMTFYGDITVTNPQTSGLYVSPAFIVDLTQSGTATPVSSTASATSFAPLTIVETVVMDFGTVAGGPAAGTVVLTTGGVRSVTGDAQILTASPGTAASFQISGEPNLVYALTYTDGTLENLGGQQMTITAFTSNSLGTMPGTGTETFQVGATLNMGANQPKGNYSTATGGGNAYSITINYN